MKAVKLFLLFLTLGLSSTFAQTTWTFDKVHSQIKFSVTHLLITDVTGSFKDFEGSVVANNDDFTDSKIDFTVNVGTISTDNNKRDNHLKSDDFFNAEKYPQMVFKSTSFKKVGDKKYKLTGDLTMKNITKQIVLDVVHNGTVQAWGGTKAGFKITGSLNRFDYDLKWNSLLEAGGAVVGKTVRIECNVELDKQSNQ